MADKDDVERFLQEFKLIMGVFGIIFRDDRGKNIQTLADLEITPRDRNDVIENLALEDYCDGPLEDTLYHGPGIWIFGKIVKDEEVFIKISFGKPNNEVVCISFHVADHPLEYPFKGA